MLKLSNSDRGWVAIACALWVIVLVAVIFIPLSKPSAYAQVHHTNSLQKAMEDVRPSGDAVAAQLIDPSRIYSDDFTGYTTLCPTEPDELIVAKQQMLNLDPAEYDLSGEFGYVLLIPNDQSAPVKGDKVELSRVDICSLPQEQMYPLNAPIPFFKEANGWVMGVAS